MELVPLFTNFKITKLLFCAFSGDKPSVFGISAEEGVVNIWDYEQVGKNVELGTRSPNAAPGLFFKHCGHRSLFNNSLNGSIPSNIWENRTFNSTEQLILDMQNNRLSGISGILNLPPNVTLSLFGNPVACSNASIEEFCGSPLAFVNHLQSTPSNSTDNCPPQSCPPPNFEYAPGSEVPRIRSMFTQWNIPDDEIFGPYELLDFTLLDPYKDVILISSPSSGLSKGALAGIVVGAIVVAVLVAAVVSLYILRLNRKKYHAVSKNVMFRGPPLKSKE